MNSSQKSARAIKPGKTGKDSVNNGDPSSKDKLAQSLAAKVLDIRYDLQILQSLRRIIRAIDIHSRKLRIQHDITAPQLVCLLSIADDGPITSTKISQHVHLSPSTLVGILDRLEMKGLIQRKRDTKDRRLVYVTATEKGLETVKYAPSPLQDGLATALKDLPELEQTTIALSLERIVDLMEVRHIEAGPILETGQLDEEGTEDGPSFL